MNDTFACLHFFLLKCVRHFDLYLSNHLEMFDHTWQDYTTDQCKNDNVACLHFLPSSPDPYFYFISGLNLSDRLKYLNASLKDYTIGKRGMLYARLTTQ